MVQPVLRFQVIQGKFHRSYKMAITLQARRSSGDMFTSEDNIEIVFNYTDIGTMHEALTTIEQVSGVTVTHGGGGAAGDYLHYKAYDLHADENGYIDYSSQTVQVQQAEKGVSVIKIKVKYLSKTDYDAWEAEMQTWRDTYVTTEILADGTSIDNFAEGTPDEPRLTHSYLTTGEITLNWSDDTFV